MHFCYNGPFTLFVNVNHLMLSVMKVPNDMQLEYIVTIMTYCYVSAGYNTIMLQLLQVMSIYYS